ncbi:hypothetical protein QSV34_11750 [Porticoccus sp. W117]|uniref:hypothetical protein n=1 Tax=Porticoccus sp. W117 TaxID=3054777 RepID=UPI002593C9E5|nr:hypothetical protein [Porticoccus sp. W117]MDM3872021.1 hypothetical protein [Porticoccus sp. W117]
MAEWKRGLISVLFFFVGLVGVHLLADSHAKNMMEVLIAHPSPDLYANNYGFQYMAYWYMHGSMWLFILLVLSFLTYTLSGKAGKKDVTRRSTTRLRRSDAASGVCTALESKMKLLPRLFKDSSEIPESDFIVHDDGIRISVIYPDGNRQSISWNELSVIEVQTYESWGMDVWFILKSNSHEISFPLGSNGDKAVIENLKKLPGFVIKGMNSIEKQTFTCWKHTSSL